MTALVPGRRSVPINGASTEAAPGSNLALSLPKSARPDKAWVIVCSVRPTDTSSSTWPGVASGPRTATREAPAARRFTWAALAAAALGRYDVTATTSSPSSSPAGGMPVRLVRSSSTTRRAPPWLPAWLIKPDTALVAAWHSLVRLAAGVASGRAGGRSGSRRDRTQRPTAALVRTATRYLASVTSPRQCFMAFRYCPCW